MADGLQFDLVSPERILVSETVESVVVPGREGYFTVLARHAPFMSTLKPRLVEVRGLGGGDVRRIFVRGGFADVAPAGLTILADQATRLEDLDSASLAAEIRSAEEALARVEPSMRAGAEATLSDLREAQRWIIPA